MQNNFNKKIAGATKWSTLTEIGARLTAPITNAVLARLLVPEAFGVVATLTMVISFAEIFTDAGFQKYLVQHEFENEYDLKLSTNVAFWTNIFFSFLIWGGIAIFATPIANMVGSPGHEKAIIVISAEIPLLAFSSIQMARYRRDFDFRNLFVSRMAVAMVPLVITVPAAFIFRSYWALVIGTLAKDVLNAIILTVRSRWKPSFSFDLHKLKDMVSFSLWTVVENITLWLSANVGTFIVGTILGSYYLGLYKTTITTVSGYYNIIQGAVMPVLFAALSRCQEDQQAFEKIFFKFQRMISVLVFPLGFGVFVYRDLATLILLGDQWLETSNFLGMRSLVHTFMLVFSHFYSEAFRSKGRPRLSALAQVLYLFVLIPTVYYSAHKGYGILSIAGGMVNLSLLFFTAIITQVALKLSFLRSVRNVWPAMLSAGIMSVAGMLFVQISDSIIWQIISVILCAVIYFMTMLLIPSGRRQLLEIPIIDRIVEKLAGKKQVND